METIKERYGNEKAEFSAGVMAAYALVYGVRPYGMDTQANQMVRYWQGSSDWISIPLNDAQKYANDGYFVVAGWINPTGDSGHVVVVVSGDACYNKYWGYLPHVMDTGKNKRSEDQLLNCSFARGKKSGIRFFYRKK